MCPVSLEYNNEYASFRDASNWMSEVHKWFEKRHASEPWTNSKAKTLPFTAEIKVYLNKLYEDYKNAEEPFKPSKYSEYTHFLRKTIEVFQIFKHNLSGEPDEEY